MSIKNNYFNNDYKNKLEDCNSDFNDLLFKDFTETEVHVTILKLKNSNSPDFDMITSELLKTIAVTIIKPLAYLIDLSFKLGISPKIYKQ